MPATGMVGTTASVAASVMKPEPVTPLAPLDVTMATARIVSCWSSVSSMPVAWAMKITAIVI
ncbi:hypothetical protein D3C72_1341200 [compost metagenome]